MKREGIFGGMFDFVLELVIPTEPDTVGRVEGSLQKTTYRMCVVQFLLILGSLDPSALLGMTKTSTTKNTSKISEADACCDDEIVVLWG